jgi:hypothetical protein
LLSGLTGALPHLRGFIAPLHSGASTSGCGVPLAELQILGSIDLSPAPWERTPRLRLNNLENGKIMRRILRKIAEDEFGNLGDTSTLADPVVVDDLVNNRQNKSKESA